VGIPKIIHYCWFGGAPKNELILKCMESWKEFCPDYKIIEWNEGNFDLSVCPYVQEAYEAKKWAFVTDYVRVWALNQFGGVYLDTDVEIRASLDSFLAHDAFTGFERPDLPFTAVFGCKKNHSFTEIILHSYDGRHFVLEDGSFDMKTNTESVTELLVNHYGIRLDNSVQHTHDGLYIYPNDFFCPKSHSDNVVRITQNTYAIHWFDGSWMNADVKKKHQRIQKWNRLFGETAVSNVCGIISCIKSEGIGSYLRIRFNKYLRKWFEA